MKKLMFIFLMLSLSAHSVQPIRKGEVATSDGFIFNTSEEREVRQINEEKKLLEQLSVHQKANSDILEERIKNYKTYVDENQRLSGYEKTMYIGAGVLGAIGTLFLSSIILKNTK